MHTCHHAGRLRALCKHVGVGLQARACMRSTPFSPILEPSLLMSRLVAQVAPCWQAQGTRQACS